MTGEIMRVDPRFKAFVKELRALAERDGVRLSEREITELIEQYLRYSVLVNSKGGEKRDVWKSSLF